MESQIQASLESLCAKYSSDKGGYIRHYERHFSRFRDRPVRLLEMGVYRGASLLMWREYFARGLIAGLDLAPNPLKEAFDRIRFFQGSQDDEGLLDRIANEIAPEGFDIIIDDAAHIGHLATKSFNVLARRHLKPDGIYVVEDWGTGYWRNWPDGVPFTSVELGRNQSFGAGMVGLVKSFVDEVAWSDVTHPRNGDLSLPVRPPLLSSVTVYPGVVFLTHA